MAFFRQFAAQLLLTVVSAISLLGTGLHLLPGCDHFHDEHQACNEHADCGHSHSDHPVGDKCNSDSDCAICRFLAIPWALTSAPALVDAGRPLEFLEAASEAAPAIEPFLPYAARAPPRLFSVA